MKTPLQKLYQQLTHKFPQHNITFTQRPNGIDEVFIRSNVKENTPPILIGYKHAVCFTIVVKGILRYYMNIHETYLGIQGVMKYREFTDLDEEDLRLAALIKRFQSKENNQ